MQSRAGGGHEKVLRNLRPAAGGSSSGPRRRADTVVQVARSSPERGRHSGYPCARCSSVETGGPIESSSSTTSTLWTAWAFGDVQLQRPGGVPIDWSKTKFAEAYKEGAFEPQHTLFLLHDTGTGWSLVEFAVGPTDIAWDWWRQQHALPETFCSQNESFACAVHGN